MKLKKAMLIAISRLAPSRSFLCENASLFIAFSAIPWVPEVFFSLASGEIGRRPSRVSQRPTQREDYSGHNREHKLQPETAQEKPLAPRVFCRPSTLKRSKVWRCTCEYKGRYVFSWGGRAGASEERVIDESEHQKGRAIPHVSYSREGHTSFPEFFNENFCDDAFHFSYRLSFSFHLL